MSAESIKSLLERRGAWLKGAGGDRDGALARGDLTGAIGERYPLFERLRDAILHGPQGGRAHALVTGEGQDLAELMGSRGVIELKPRAPPHPTVAGRKYLSGGWLEELAYLAAVDAGAEEAMYGQNIGWSAGGFAGENEIDLIVRRGGVMAFVSCKALKSTIGSEDRKLRNRLMDAIHEADNLADHFGRPGERVAVMVTTDLFDEMRGVPRYAALMGKAAVLDVRIIALEDLNRARLVHALGELMSDNRKDATG